MLASYLPDAPFLAAISRSNVGTTPTNIDDGLCISISSTRNISLHLVNYRRIIPPREFLKKATKRHAPKSEMESEKENSKD